MNWHLIHQCEQDWFPTPIIWRQTIKTDMGMSLPGDLIHRTRCWQCALIYLLNNKMQQCNYVAEQWPIGTLLHLFWIHVGYFSKMMEMNHCPYQINDTCFAWGLGEYVIALLFNCQKKKWMAFGNQQYQSTCICKDYIYCHLPTSLIHLRP